MRKYRKQKILPRKVVCDVCGFVVPVTEAVLINDRYNTLNGLLVCKDDVEKTNPQAYRKAIKERPLDDPKTVRPEQPERIVFISDPSEIAGGDTSDPVPTILPSEPRELSLYNISVTTVELLWQGPISPGSSPVSGYKIERENPKGGGFSTVLESTESVASYYKDTGLSASTQYNYRISTVTRAGTSTGTSNEFDVTTPSS